MFQLAIACAGFAVAMSQPAPKPASPTEFSFFTPWPTTRRQGKKTRSPTSFPTIVVTAPTINAIYLQPTIAPTEEQIISIVPISVFPVDPPTAKTVTNLSPLFPTPPVNSNPSPTSSPSIPPSPADTVAPTSASLFYPSTPPSQSVKITVPVLALPPSPLPTPQSIFFASIALTDSPSSSPFGSSTTSLPTSFPSTYSLSPTAVPTAQPTISAPTQYPTGEQPTHYPTGPQPTFSPSFAPTSPPTELPTATPTPLPSYVPTFMPSHAPTSSPSFEPTSQPTVPLPTAYPTASAPTHYPTGEPPTFFPSFAPSKKIKIPLPTPRPPAAPPPTFSPTASAPPTDSPTSNNFFDTLLQPPTPPPTRPRTPPPTAKSVPSATELQPPQCVNPCLSAVDPCLVRETEILPTEERNTCLWIRDLTSASGVKVSDSDLQGQGLLAPPRLTSCGVQSCSCSKQHGFVGDKAGRVCAKLPDHKQKQPSCLPPCSPAGNACKSLQDPLNRCIKLGKKKKQKKKKNGGNGDKKAGSDQQAAKAPLPSPPAAAAPAPSAAEAVLLEFYYAYRARTIEQLPPPTICGMGGKGSSPVHQCICAGEGFVHTKEGTGCRRCAKTPDPCDNPQDPCQTIATSGHNQCVLNPFHCDSYYCACHAPGYAPAFSPQPSAAGPPFASLLHPARAPFCAKAPGMEFETMAYTANP